MMFYSSPTMRLPLLTHHDLADQSNIAVSKGLACGHICQSQHCLSNTTRPLFPLMSQISKNPGPKEHELVSQRRIASCQEERQTKRQNLLLNTGLLKPSRDLLYHCFVLTEPGNLCDHHGRCVQAYPDEAVGVLHWSSTMLILV